jgi:NAD(P)-dependent dehydrogenase (short-subunit alcohol dehydrogenase family)
MMKKTNEVFSLEEWETCLKVLTILKDNPTENPNNQKFSGLISKIYKSNKKQNRKNSLQDKREHDIDIKKQTTLSKVALENQTLYHPIKELNTINALELKIPQSCYSCHKQYRTLHSFYHRLCPSCAEHQHNMRFLNVDLTGRNVILTGGRIKVGFATALRLLKNGANLCLTTRFPALALQQFKQEVDYEDWANRLFIYGLDLRSLQDIEDFIDFYKKKYVTLDILINNAAQTIQYTDKYYLPIIQLENQSAQVLLKNHETKWISNKSPIIQSDNQINLSKFSYPTALSRFGQPIDNRKKNSWNSKFEDIELQELLEVNLINHIAPYRLIQGLKSCLLQSKFTEKFIINVTSSEGIFSYHNKTSSHPHTNMTKAALNMLTRTSAQDFANDQIYMCAVDVGWISTGAIEGLRQKQFNQGIIPPLDPVDGASRILHPIASGLDKRYFIGSLLKDYKIHTW